MFAQESVMDIQKEKIKQEFWSWAKVENPRVVEDAELGDVYAIQTLDHMFMGFAAAKTQAVPEGFVLVNVESLALHAQSIRMFNNSDEEDDYYEIENHVCAIEAMIEAQEPAND